MFGPEIYESINENYAEDVVEKQEFAHILKANPYHDEKGRFSTKDKAKFVSTGGVFDKQRANAKARAGGDKDKSDFQDRNDDNEFAEDHKKKLDGLPDSQRAALRAYTGSFYEGINNHLRMDEEISDFLKDTISNMDAAMEKATLGKDVIAYRGIKGNYSDRLQKLHKEGKLIGATLEDKGFSSVTVDKEVAKSWSGSVNLELKIPKTAKGFFVGHQKGELKHYTKYDKEKEIIMNRGAKIKITGARKEEGVRLILEGEWM